MSKIINFKCYYCEYNIKHKVYDSDVVTEEQQFNYATYPNKKTLFTSQEYICNNCQVIEKKYIDHLQNEIKRILKEDKVNISTAKKAQKYYKKFTSQSLELLKKECMEVASDTAKTFENMDHVQQKRDPKTCLSCGTSQNRHKDNCNFLNDETYKHCLKIGYIHEINSILHLTKKGLDYINKIESLTKEERNRFNNIQKSRVLYNYLLQGIVEE